MKKAEYEKLIAMEPNIDKSIEESYNIIEETATNYFNTTPQEELILLFNDFLLMPFVDESTIKFSKMQSTKSTRFHLRSKTSYWSLTVSIRPLSIC